MSTSSPSPSFSPRARLGLGAARLPSPSPSPSFRQGLGSGHAACPSSPSSSLSSGARSALPSTFGGSKSRKRRRAASPPTQKTEIADAPGAWEKHTRGIGSRILAKHGFKGRLGARETGIAAPLEAKVRPKGMGLGAGGVEKRDIDRVSELVKKRDGETAAGKVFMGERWRKRGLVVQQMEESKDEVEREEVKELLKSAREHAVFAAPEVSYNVTMLAEGALAEVEKERRRVSTEELICNTARKEMEIVKGDIRTAETAVQCLQKVPAVLDGVKAAEEDDGFCIALNKLVSVMEEISQVNCIKMDVLQQAVFESVERRVRGRLEEALQGDGSGRKGRLRAAAHVHEVLSIARETLSVDEYLVLCTTSVLQAARMRVSRAGWDAVSGAWIADVLSEVGGVLPEAVVEAFAEDVLVPKLVDRVEKELKAGKRGGVPVHVWVHAWLPVVGRRALGEVLGRVRVWLGKRLENWKVEDVKERDSLVEIIETWSGVLSRRKMQLSLARHVTPRLVEQIREVCEERQIVTVECKPIGFENLEVWSHVGSGRLLGKAVVGNIFRGLCGNLRDVLFEGGEEDSWKRGCELYRRWKSWMPGKLIPYIRGGLAGLLFLIQVAREGDEETRGRLKRADVGVLLQNRFGEVWKKEVGESEKGETGVKEKTMSVKDIVLHIANREGLVVVGDKRREDGLAVLKVGNVKVAVDGRRGVLLSVEGKTRVIGMDEMIRLAKR